MELGEQYTPMSSVLPLVPAMQRFLPFPGGRSEDSDSDSEPEDSESEAEGVASGSDTDDVRA